MKLPNFFIIGAPKCGTTALAEYLGGHPSVFMSFPKEPHYFAADFPRYREPVDWESYRSLFAEADAHVAVGEASVYYLASEVAVPAILLAVPDARFIVMLRDPVQMAVSMHAQVLFNRDENVESFAQAWRLCSERRAGRKVSRHCRDAKVLDYARIALLGWQLQRVLAVVPAERVHCIFFDDLQADAGKVYREALQFLGVADDGRCDFTVVNARKRARSHWISQFVFKTPKPLVHAAMAAKRVLGIRQWGVSDRLLRWNTAADGRPELPQALEREMREHFAEDVRLLQSLTARELSGWLPVGWQEDPA